MQRQDLMRYWEQSGSRWMSRNSDQVENVFHCGSFTYEFFVLWEQKSPPEVGYSQDSHPALKVFFGEHSDLILVPLSFYCHRVYDFHLFVKCCIWISLLNFPHGCIMCILQAAFAAACGFPRSSTWRRWSARAGTPSRWGSCGGATGRTSRTKGTPLSLTNGAKGSGCNFGCFFPDICGLNKY